MGRDVKRVALDFDWPLRKTYEGYLMPDELRAMQCTTCEGDGLSAHSKHLRDQWYGYVPFRPEDKGSTPVDPRDPEIVEMIRRKVTRDEETLAYYKSIAGGTDEGAVSYEARRMCGLWNGRWMHHLTQDDVDVLLDAGRLMDLTHDHAPGKGWQPKDPPVRPTAEQVNRWSLQGMGHDSINQWVVTKAEAKRNGESDSCAVCGGDGESFRDDVHRKTHDAWSSHGPPPGEGWQMWENTSEGSPISPVFRSPEALANWLSVTGASAFGREGASYEAWLEMIVGPGFAPSMVLVKDAGETQ